MMSRGQAAKGAGTLSASGVSKVFNEGRPNRFTALDDVSIDVELGGVTLFKGPSGSGKTTLLSVLGCMTRPTSGRVYVRGEEVTSLPEKFLTEIRRRTYGFIFQHFNLVRGLTVLENVMIPAYPLGMPRPLLRARALELLDQFSIADKAEARVEWLSGGQAQRVAIARALINDPAVVIADEPTAHLDSKLAAGFVEIVRDIAGQGRGVLIASHDPVLLESDLLSATVTMRDGAVVEVAWREAGDPEALG